jgi:hypothetical protein
LCVHVRTKKISRSCLCSHAHREEVLFVLSLTRPRERAHSRSWIKESMAARLAPAQREEQSGTGACYCSMAIGPVFVCVLVCVCGVVGCLYLSESASLPPPAPLPPLSASRLPDLLPNLLCAGQLRNCYSAHTQICHELTSVTASLEARIAAQADIFNLFSKIEFADASRGGSGGSEWYASPRSMTDVW